MRAPATFVGMKEACDQNAKWSTGKRRGYGGPRGACRIGSWIAFYDGTHPHQALGYRTPLAVLREGVSGGYRDIAVDMTLRLDNAVALPTSPQPQQ